MWTLTQEVETSAGVLAADKAGRGRSLVLAHGWPWSSYSWHKLIPVLCESFEVYWYDMLGYGMSEKYPDQRTGLDVQAEIFCEMVEHWDLVNPIVLAHDFGGATTLRAHLLHVAFGLLSPSKLHGPVPKIPATSSALLQVATLKRKTTAASTRR